jgi:hypothetical protein
MIPNGSDHMIRRALGYMTVPKVGQWARTMICPNITDRDIIRIQRSMSAPRRIGTAKDTALGPYTPHNGLVDDGTLGRKIDAFVAARSKECGVHPDFYRRSLGWR